MSDWIECSERMPELDADMSMDVWAFAGEETGVYLEIWSTENSDEGEFVKYEGAKELFDCCAPPGSRPPSRITHWMPVDYPEPPIDGMVNPNPQQNTAGNIRDER